MSNCNCPACRATRAGEREISQLTIILLASIDALDVEAKKQLGENPTPKERAHLVFLMVDSAMQRKGYNLNEDMAGELSKLFSQVGFEIRASK